MKIVKLRILLHKKKIQCERVTALKLKLLTHTSSDLRSYVTKRKELNIFVLNRFLLNTHIKIISYLKKLSVAVVPKDRTINKWYLGKEVVVA